MVIGGGPAGCAAAISAAQAGLRVLLVERLNFPRQLGVWEQVESAGFIRHPGQRVIWAGERRFSRFGGTEVEPWLGFQAWRPVLDAILLRRAAAVGVEVWHPCAAVSPVMGNGRVLGVVTERREVRAKFVVDATGGGGWLARKLGLLVELRSPRLIANYAYIETEQAGEWFLPELQSTLAGWMWMAQVLPQVVAWTGLSLNDPSSGVPDGLAKLAGARRLAVGGASADVTWRFADNAAGLGYFLTGDAAMVIDPASSHGVLRALMSGMMAAHLSARVCHDGLAEESAATAYVTWLRAWFEHDAEKLGDFYGQLATPPEWLTGDRSA
jgi:flavin-dependent dehydrogenase